MRDLRLTTKFAIYSFLVIAVIGFISGSVLARQIRKELFQDFVSRSRAIQHAVLSPHLKKSDFLPGDKRLAGPGFNNLVEKTIISDDLLFIKIWRADGTVLYSNNRKVIGKKIKPKINLKKALQGKTTYQQEALTERPTALKNLLEIYAPVKFNGKILGAYETYFSLKPVFRSIRRLILTMVLILSGGLTLLWLSLYELIKKASTTIDQQNAGLIKLTEDLTHSMDEMQENYLGTMESLALAVEARDPYTGRHSHRLESLGFALGQELRFSEEQLRQLEMAGVLHDIGKIGIPEKILMKPGPLDPDEWRTMKNHPTIGAAIIDRVPFLKEVAPIVKHHHEHFDGTGYPDGLTGVKIPVEARILAVLDAFDAMISNRPYRQALSKEEALHKIEEEKGRQFDPQIVETFISLHRKRPDIFRSLKAA